MQAGSGDNLPISEINVTPLVDVMLVLLIIFMVAAPHLEQGVPVKLPEVTVTPLPAQTDEFIITVTEDKNVYLNKEKTSLSRLEPILREVVKARGDRDVYIRADRDVPYGVVVRVMAAARKAGIEGLGMVTEPERIREP
jgi:biopolymer transport protein TolR